MTNIIFENIIKIFFLQLKLNKFLFDQKFFCDQTCLNNLLE